MYSLEYLIITGVHRQVQVEGPTLAPDRIVDADADADRMIEVLRRMMG